MTAFFSANVATSPAAMIPANSASSLICSQGISSATTEGEDDIGEETAGEDDIGEKTAGEDDIGEETAGEDDIGEETAGEDDIACCSCLFCDRDSRCTGTISSSSPTAPS